MVSAGEWDLGRIILASKAGTEELLLQATLLPLDHCERQPKPEKRGGLHGDGLHLPLAVKAATYRPAAACLLSTCQCLSTALRTFNSHGAFQDHLFAKVSQTYACFHCRLLLRQANPGTWDLAIPGQLTR